MHDIISLCAVLIASGTFGYLLAFVHKVQTLEKRLAAAADQLETAQSTFQQVGKDVIARLENAEQKLTSHDFKLNAPLKKF